ncbi:MAG: 5-formyltetrahydrofolate cyclo-ligase [Candidatus Peribacteraceae bacterium]|nr:5-formyltetrahydrofolate cyclo-ligase [Candidatus Peribacteraceae bacterium]
MIADQKAQLRREIAQRITLLSPERRKEESESICRTLLPLIEPGMAVCGYAPLPSEPDITPLLAAFIKRGNALYLPRYENGTVVFLRVEDLSKLVRGNQNILEPSQDAAPLGKEGINIVLVPGRAFDGRGNRLGRGAGGYDAWIATARENNKTMRCIGIAFACQLVGDVPTEPHDQRMDALALPSGYRAVEGE